MSDQDFFLKQSLESLDFALKSGRMGTWDINLSDDSIHCSQEMLDLWGIESTQYSNDRSIMQAKVHPDDREKMKEAIAESIKNRTIYEMEFRIIPEEGVIKWVLSRGRCTFAPHSEEPVRFAGVVYEITERKLKEELSQKLIRDREKFYMMASHELRTPLTVLQLQIQVLEWELKHRDSPSFTFSKMEESVRRQKSNLLRISRIVDNIFDESTISSGKLHLRKEVMDFHKALQENIQQFRNTIEFTQLEVTYSGSPVEVFWDRFRMDQVISNLLINAYRYGNKKPIHVSLRQENDNAVISIKDFGIGIDPEDQKRIFNQFERINPGDGLRGMGLGLYISKNLVEAHQGKIIVQSSPGLGSTFTLIIPTGIKTTPL